MMTSAIDHFTLPLNREFDIHPTLEGTTVSQEVNVLALVKGKERYLFLYNEQHYDETLRMLARYASNPELSFTWYDAAVLSQKIRQDKKQQALLSQKREAASPRGRSLGVEVE